MISFIQNNLTICLFGAVAIISLILIFVFIKMGNKNDAELKKIKKAKAEKPKVEQAIKKDAPKFQGKPQTSETNLTESYIKKKRKLKYFFRVDENIDEEEKEKEKKKKTKQISKSKFNGSFVYKGTVKRCDMKDYNRRKEEKDLLGRMEFVKSSKSVAKLAKRKDMLKVPVPKQPEVEQQQQTGYDLNLLAQKTNKFESKMTRRHEYNEERKAAKEAFNEERRLRSEERKSSYFNKDRRLSRFVNSGDYDSLFSSHISDDLINIDVDRHLHLDYKFERNLFRRAARTLSYGEIKINDDKNLAEKGYRKSWLKERRNEEYRTLINGDDYVPDFMDKQLYQDELDTEYIETQYNDDLEGYNIRAGVDLAPKNLLAVDSILYRKNNYSRRSARQNTNSRKTTGDRK